MPKAKVDDELAALIAAAGDSTPPKDLGNLPGDDDLSVTAETPESEAPVEPEGEPEPAEPEPEPEAPSAYDQRLAALEARLAATERENAVLRAGQPAVPPQAPTDPLEIVQRYIPGTVTRQDVETVLADPEKGAEYMTALLRAAALGGARMALDASRAEMDTKLKQHEETRSVRERFWADNDDLRPVSDLVQTAAQAVYAEGITDADRLIAETAKRVRARCKELGIRLSGTAPARGKVAQRGIRPAFAEGARGAPGGKTTVNKIEQDIFQMSQVR